MSLTVYLKPTNYCNIGCSHCYLPESTRAEKNIMSEETLKRVGEMAIELAAREGHRTAHFVWHGGEPMVLSPEYYWRAFEALDAVIGREYYTSSLQTALIPYRDAWAPLIRERFDGCIGSSIDFGQRRIQGSDSSYLDLWMDKVEQARNDGFIVIPGMVPTQYQVDYAGNIMDWFAERDFPFFNVDRFSRYGNENSLEWPSNAEHSKFLIGLFDRAMAMMESGKEPPRVNVLTAGLRGVLYGQPGDRWGTNCQREFLVIEPDGNINSCPDRAMHEPAHSNAHQGTDALQRSEGRRKWIRVMEVGHKRSHCEDCEYNHFCKSGCPVTPNGPEDGQHECSGYKSFLRHINRYMQASEANRERVLHYLDSLGMVPIVPERSIRERTYA